MDDKFFTFLIGVFVIVVICFFVYISFDFIKTVKEIKRESKEITRLTWKVYNDTEVGEFFTLKSGQEIVITDKFLENDTLYFEYKCFNEDARTMADVTEDEKYVVTVKNFATIVNVIE